MDQSYEKYEKYYMESRKKGTSYVQQKGGRLTGSVMPCVGTAFCYTLFKEG